MNQHEREKMMFDLGLGRLERQIAQANTKNYGSSGAGVNQLSYHYIQAFANALQIHVEDRIRRNLPSKGDVALANMCALYTQLPVDGASILSQPHYGYCLIAATAWKTIADAALSPDVQRRVDLKTQIGHLLELQFKVRFYDHYADQLDIHDEHSGEHNKLLAQKLRQLKSLVEDNGATLQRRIGRARGLYHEPDRGTLVVRRGRKSKGAELFIPKAERFQHWEDPFREFAAAELLDLMCVPKGQVVADDDPRPFQYHKNKRLKGGDLVYIRPVFREAINKVLKELQKSAIDFLPLIELPRPWVHAEQAGTSNNSGGYWSDGISGLKQCALVRFGLGQCDTVPSRLAIDFLNKLQSTEWVVDHAQADIVRHIGLHWETDYDGIFRPLPYTCEDIKKSREAAALLPQVQYRDLNKDRYKSLMRRFNKQQRLLLSEMEFVHDYEENNVELRELYRRAENSSQNVKAFAQVMARFDKIRNDETLYFAWNYDSRGRAYAIGGYGQPQSEPASRYTLTFKNGERLSDQGERNALRAIGTAMIDSKVSIDQRIKYAEDNMDLIREIGEGTPRSMELALGGGDFDSPLELLNLCRNWVQHEDGGLWRAPIYADAVCSGYQIVAALINNHKGLNATNVVPMTALDDPNDAYRICLDVVTKWLDNRQHEIMVGDWDGKERIKRQMTIDERQLLLAILTGKKGKLGRKISKSYARTSVYGSGAWTQSTDIQTELFKADISDNDVPAALRMALTQLITQAYSQELGSIGKYNRGIKAMAKARLFTGVDPKVKAAWELLNAERGKYMDKNCELPNGKLNEYLELCRLIYQQSKHGLSFTLPDGTYIDERQYVLSREEYKTVFHGSPTIPITHVDALSPQNILKAVAPDVIHSLDGLVLRYAYTDAPYEIVTIHDSAGCLPNEFDDLCLRYRQGFLKATSGNFLESLAKQWNTELKVEIGNDTSWRDGVLNATNMFH